VHHLSQVFRCQFPQYYEVYDVGLIALRKTLNRKDPVTLETIQSFFIRINLQHSDKIIIFKNIVLLTTDMIVRM